MFKDFFDILKENLDSYENTYASFINHSPYLFKLLTDLLNKYSYTIKKEDKMKINSAISYFVIPTDVISEKEYGPYGYIDDIYISVYVLKDIINIYGYQNIKKLWEGKGELNNVLDECYNKSLEVIDNPDKLLKFAGLS